MTGLRKSENGGLETEMATRKIVKIGDDTLRKTCRNQEKYDLRLAILLKDMADTMYKAEGVGLAAPQVGILRRIAVVDVTEDHSGLVELINPRLLESDGTQTGREGCLSVPGRQAVVTRPRWVRVAFQDRHGKPQELEAEGLCEARRGLGTFVTEESGRIDALRNRLAQEAVEQFLNRIAQLGLTREDAVRMMQEVDQHA